MPNAYAHRLRLRLFLEGVEVPVISANVRVAPNGPMTAAIQMPPLAEGTKFLPRTVVHLFFLDFRSAANPFIKFSDATRTIERNPSVYEKALQDNPELREFESKFENGETIDNAPIDATNKDYRLLFGGEVVGFTWTKSVNQRSLVLQCLDWSNYWDYAYQWNNTGIFGPGIKAVFSGGATNLFTDFLTSKGNIITSIVSSGYCNSFPRLKGLAAGVIRLLESIGGSYYVRSRQDNDARRVVKKYAGQNVFFSLAELRLHITHMIAAFEDDPTSARLLARRGYIGLFNRALGGLGGQVSIRKSINALTKIMFHEVYPQPCPYFRPGLEGEVSGQVRVKLADDPDFGEMAKLAEDLRVFVTDFLASLEALEEDPTTALFNSGVRALRLDLGNKLQLAQKSANFALTQNRGAPETARSAFVQSGRLLSQARSILIGRWSPDAPEAIKSSLRDKLDRVAEQMVRVRDLTVNTTPPKLREPARLNQQILRPDIWFGAPPRCNVLFPEDYDTISYQRMFLQEPTRFMLKTNDEFFGEDFLFDRFYFAPQAGSLRSDRARLRNMLRNDLLDHELFTGILPVFEKMGEFNVFASRSGTQSQPAPKIGLAQRSANFIYFKHRFNSRQMRIDGKFNPWIACGCPGLVIDKYVDRLVLAFHNLLKEQADLPQSQISEILGTNFLGNFTGVTHRVSQMEPMGRTEIICSYPRQPEESVEFLGSPEKVQRLRVRQDVDATRDTDVAAVDFPRLFNLGPNGGRIVNVVEVTNKYVDRVRTELEQLEDAGTGGQRLPVFQRGFNTRNPTLVPIGVSVSGQSINSPEITSFTGDPARTVIFRAFQVKEEIPRYRREETDLPAEEFIRPGWYGDVWTNGKIGRVYEDFFGIGSITDGQNITDPLGATIGVANPLLEDAQAEADQAETADDLRLGAPLELELQEGSSIQAAVEFLVLTYSHIRQQGLDVEEFIRAYTWRPVATMVDLFGTSDLQLNETGETVLQGIEGFHSRAFGPFENVFGLVGPDLEDIVGIKRGSTVAQRGDTRLRKLEKVQQYVAALNFSRAILG